MQRGYIYARYSSASQKSESIEQQIAIIEDYAKRNNIEIVGTYADKAISGSTQRTVQSCSACSMTAIESRWM